MSVSSGDRYQILDRLDAGGMAEVFKAVAVSLEGFEKPVAIKRVLPQLSANERFIRMFLDEARLSLNLSHTNIVSVFDVVQTDSAYFIVMEYIEGANLKRTIEAARLRQGPIPVPIAVYIAVQMCQGLDYAHNKSDARGRELHIVHRDVSPPNVLLSWTGEVKLTDFGLAKAASQMSTTDPGVVKGKFGYLSPEAARGEVVDRRTDVFAAGIVLWEMLAGRRLFQGNTDWDTLQQVRAAEVPSLRALNASVPVELEEILRRSLALDVTQRFQTAQEFGRRLSGYLASVNAVVTAYDVAAYLKAVLSEQTAPREKTTSAMLTQAIQTELNRGAPVVGFDVSGVNSAPQEDPRSWDGFGDDENDIAESVATSYASRRSGTEDSVMIPLSMVRPGRSNDPAPSSGAGERTEMVPTPAAVRSAAMAAPSVAPAPPVMAASPALVQGLTPASGLISPGLRGEQPSEQPPEPTPAGVAAPASGRTVLLTAIVGVGLLIAVLVYFLMVARG